MNSEFGDIPLDSPWLSNPELSPGTGLFQWQHIPPGDFPITMKEEYVYTRQGP
jgi:hypothetical protein